MNKILTFAILLYSGIIYGQCTNANLIIKGINRYYFSYDTLTFEIQNISDSRLFLSIGVEIQLNSEWVKVTDDINKDSFIKNRSVFLINVDSSLKKNWIPDKTPLIDYDEDNSTTHITGKFRLFINFGSSPNQLKSTSYSKEFVIK